MSVANALDFIIRVFFISLSLLTIVDYVRFRGAIRRDVAILFSLLAIPFIFQLIASINGEEISESGNMLSILGLILEPYLVLRLLRHLRSTPARIVRFARYSMIATIVVGIIIGDKIPIITLLVSQAYLIGFNLYAMVGFVRGALSATGVARQRLRWSAAGAGLFAVVLITILLANILPQAQEIILTSAQILAIACAIAFYIGFVPPRWLRRTWQLAELRNYLLETTHNAPSESTGISDSLKRLCRSANEAVSGMAAGVAQWNEISNSWELRDDTDHTMLPSALINGKHVIDAIMQKRQAAYIYVRTIKDETERKPLEAVGADTWLLVPMIVNERFWGVLLVFLRGHSLFIEDDLNFLELLTQESAIILTNYGLIAELQSYSEQLEHKVEARTAELSESEERYRNLNIELEQRVKDRTIQLEAANKELEAFSYSVSHDLRAPLRSLDGFSQALEEDYGSQVDETARGYLSRIRSASQRMAQLIDDLLELSSLTRSEMRHEPVDLTQLACQIAAELREQYPGREVEFEAEDKLIVVGDSRLLRVALSNLLGNAWKYTSHQPQPCIKFGVTDHEGQRAYFVRDNGAGFDMAYADKLFGVFQRLHSANEFPGTGIGLATVQRVINRHGGEIWADSVVNQGATFYFSI